MLVYVYEVEQDDETDIVSYNFGDPTMGQTITNSHVFRVLC